mgnify:CR=1 FL=1
MKNFDFHTPSPSTRIPVFARNAVSTSHPLAAQAGLRMLWKGGNAIDAAIAAAAAMMICEPVSNGLGSDAFAILWDGKELHGLNASGRAPAAWTPEHFKRKYGADAKTPPKRGFDSVTVPGAVQGGTDGRVHDHPRGDRPHVGRRVVVVHGGAGHETLRDESVVMNDCSAQPSTDDPPSPAP